MKMHTINATKHTYCGSENDDDEESFQNNVNKRSLIHRINEKIPARLVLYFLSWSGFLVSFMMRNDINIALLAMVRSNVTAEPSLLNQLILVDSVNSTYINESVAVTTITSQSDLLLNQNINNHEDYGEYNWSTTIKATIVGSFYWCYVLSQVVGGVATQYFGTKNVFGWSQLATAICSLFIPYASDKHYGALIFLRSIQGFASGLTWPAMYAIVGYWIPEIERSRFMSSFQGFSIGIGLTYPLCGFIITVWGWRYVFYTTGTIGCIWCIMWYFLAYDTPEAHPRITKSELIYISKNINTGIKNAHGMKVPWIDIFKSLPTWSIGITTFGRIWVHYQFIINGPNYMKNILGFKIQSNGLLNGLPFLFSYIASVSFCYMADYIVVKNWMSLTNVRKIFTATSQIIPGILLLLIGYINNNVFIVLMIWFIAVTLITAAYAGAMATVVDIAPNLAGPVLAFAQTIHMTASFLSPVITGIIVADEKSITQWRIVFGLSVFIAFSTYIMYQIFGTSEIQSWNYPKSRSTSEESQNILEKPMSSPLAPADQITSDFRHQDVLNQSSAAVSNSKKTFNNQEEDIDFVVDDNECIIKYPVTLLSNSESNRHIV